MRKLIGYLLFGSLSIRVANHTKFMGYLRNKGYLRLAKIIEIRLQRRHGLFISSKATIGREVSFRHPASVVIGDGVLIGDRVVIYQNVTLGGARIGDGKKSNYPEIGDDTIIFAGAVIVGKVKIGRNCVVGANAVVLKDVPDNTTVVGVPARPIAASTSR